MPLQRVATVLQLIPRPLLLFLVIVTTIALLPWDPQGPFDARDWSRLQGVHLEYPWSAILMEPLLAPANAIMGAPDFRIALIASAAWITGLALVAGVARGGGTVYRVGRGLAFVLCAAGGILLYGLFMAFPHLPGWRLVAEDPRLLVADLQTHTFGSHDGLVTAAENLSWHAARGYNAIGITEHNDPRGSFAMESLARSTGSKTVVVPGVEVSDEKDRFLLGIGIDPAKGVLPWKGNQQEYGRKFIADMHAQGGAVIGLAWKLQPADVGELAAAGLDAMELVNTGHPDIPDAVRTSMLELAKQRNIVLVASTDWHGWGGFTRTWTLVALPESASPSPQGKGRALVERLRGRHAAAFTPVAAGRIGPPGIWRTVFAPFVETARYAAELSPARVISWWLWSLAVAATFSLLKRKKRQPGYLGAAAVVTVTGVWVAIRALQLRAIRMDGKTHEYAMEMGTPALILATAALGTAVLLLWLERRRAKRS